MSKVIVETELNPRGFETGLQRLLGQSQSFAASVSKKLSVQAIGGGVLGALGLNSVIEVGQRLVENWQRTAGIARTIEETSRRTVDVLRKGSEDRMTTEQRTADLRARVSAGDVELEKLNSQRARYAQQLADASTNSRALSTFIPGFLGRRLVNEEGEATLPRWLQRFAQLVPPGLGGQQAQVLAAASYAGTQSRAEQLEQRRATMEPELAALRVALRQLEEAEQLRREPIEESRDRVRDRRALQEGEIDEVQFAERERGRAAQRLINAARRGAGSLEQQELMTGIQAAGLDVTEAEIARRKRRTPTVVADSLARVGGGGNVAIFGGRDPMIEGQRRQTVILSQIAENTRRSATPTRGGGDIE